MSEPDQLKRIHDIDGLLPQTQCGLCDYDGCKPYATAIVTQGETINKCLPGGLRTLGQLGTLLNQDITPYIENMREKAKPVLTAVIREHECIGCTKCIQACPVDAIFGASKQMHTILQDACTGCELCIEPCPVDCIDLVELPTRNETELCALAEQSRQRYQTHQLRLEQNANKQRQQHQQAKLNNANQHQTLDARKAAIAEIVARNKAKQTAAN